MWGLTAHAWERISVIALIIAGVLTVVSAVIAIYVARYVQEDVQRRFGETAIALRTADERAAAANERANAASQRAAETDLARVQLQKQVSWRNVDANQRAALVAALSTKKYRIELNWTGSDAECESYARELRDVFEAAGYDVRGQPVEYRRIWGVIGPMDDPQHLGVVDHLRSAFDKAGVQYRARMNHPTTDWTVVIVASKFPVGTARLVEGPIRSQDSGDHILTIEDGRVVNELAK
jgi:hypothetical protein